ncbi:MAG: hypothetical protein KAS69_06435 [Planctomycetes bacterium]|nr:hypothetical protein [Planctomycetota bacterium]
MTKSAFKKYITTIAMVWCGGFVLLLFGYTTMLVPQRKQMQSLKKQLISQKENYEYAISATLQDNKDKLSEQIELLRSKLTDFVVDFEDSANLTFDIGKIASEKKVSAFKIGFKNKCQNLQGQEYSYINEKRINVSFNASFNRCAAFLNSLERHRPIIFVDEFKITQKDCDKSQPLIDMELAVFVKNMKGS